VPDDNLSVKIVLDASQLDAGLKSAANVVSSATTQMGDKFSALAHAAIVSATANRELQGTLTTLARRGLAPAAEDVEDVAKAMFDARVATDALKAAQQEASPALEQTARSANNARSAMLGLTNELGLRGNRALSTFISQSQTLGPILNAAFTGIAIVGFIQLAAQAAEKLSTLIADTFVFTQAEKDLAQQINTDNAEIKRANDEHIKQLRDIAVLGKPLAEQERLRAQFAKDDAAGLKETIRAKEQELVLERQKLNLLQQQKDQPPDVVSTGPEGVVLPDNSKEIAEQDRKVQSLSSSLAVLKAQYVNAGDAVQAATGKFNIEAAKEHEKALEKEREEADRLNAKLQQITNTLFRLGQEQKTLAREEETFGETAVVKQAQEQQRATDKLLEAERRVAEEQRKDLEANAVAAITLRERQVQEELRLGRIGVQGAKQQLDELAREKLQTELNSIAQAQGPIQQRLATSIETDAEDLKEWQRLQSQKLAVYRQFNAQIERNAEQTATAENNKWKQALTGIFASVNSSLIQVLNRQERVGVAIQKIWTGIVDSLLTDFLKIGEKWIAQHLIMAAVSKLFHLQDAASKATSAAAGIAAAKAEGAAQVGLAGAGGTASMAAAPFPLDLTAPDFGAAMAAIAGSFLVFEQGGIVPGSGPQLAIVHGGELILNERQQRAGVAPAAAGHSFTYNNYAHGDAEQARATGREFLKLAQREIRRRHL
jgi:hypothetical protein